jgi:branched-chain amino acid transport system ATP-binding protein
MLLDVKSLTVHYVKAEALKNVSINVGEGEVVTIIGTNGAGKTTLLKSIAGLVPTITAGEIWCDGQRIDGLAANEVAKSGVKLCMEGRRVFPYMTVLENLELGAFIRQDKNEIRHDLEGVLKRFPVLDRRRSQKAGTLSGGEQQMLAIGRAIMSRPKLLALDEPSLGLAPLVVSELGKIINDLNDSGLTVLLVEQNAQMAMRLAHRGYVLEVGEITLSGDAQFLSKNDYVKRAYLGV